MRHTNSTSPGRGWAVRLLTERDVSTAFAYGRLSPQVPQASAGDGLQLLISEGYFILPRTPKDDRVGAEFTTAVNRLTHIAGFTSAGLCHKVQPDPGAN